MLQIYTSTPHGLDAHAVYHGQMDGAYTSRHVAHAMITSVAVWRCECGVTIKVVTETDRARIAEIDHLTASCPNCGDEQLVYAHRIISVTSQKNETSLA